MDLIPGRLGKPKDRATHQAPTPWVCFQLEKKVFSALPWGTTPLAVLFLSKRNISSTELKRDGTETLVRHSHKGDLLVPWSIPVVCQVIAMFLGAAWMLGMCCSVFDAQDYGCCSSCPTSASSVPVSACPCWDSHHCSVSLNVT